MNMNDFRKKIFLNSQYCTYYIDNGCTVLAGIMRNLGYKYAVKLPQEKLTQVNLVYRKFTTLMNCLAGAEILLFIYLFMFPYFLKLMELPFFVMALSLSVIPLVMLYLTYIFVNCLYENYLTKYTGAYQKVKFQPNIYKIDPMAFKLYKETPRKSIYIMAFVIIAFLCYIFVPLIIDTSVTNGKYKNALNMSNIYLKIVPISPDMYAQRAYSKFKLRKYMDAVDDYKLANAYSKSQVFNLDILGTKTYYLNFDEMIKEFDLEITKREKKVEKQFILAEKANYLMKNNKYNQALNIYNELINTYENREDIAFAPEEIYYNRGKAKALTGDINGAKNDIAVSKKMCFDCKFSYDTKLVIKP